MKHYFKKPLFITIICALSLAPLFLSTHTTQADNEIMWGVDFSESQAEYLELDPRETYSAIIHELGAKHIKMHINFNKIQKQKHVYDFDSLDWQVSEAEKNDVKLIMVVGIKTGRWPECHTPYWLTTLSEKEQKKEIAAYTAMMVERYKKSPAVEYWQIENEPFLEFGECPSWYYDKDSTLLATQIAAVRLADPTRKIIISESGELSKWTKSAEIADIVGVTMYRSSWNHAEKTFGINPYSFLAPEFYSAKAAFIRSYYNKPVISIELQAEPWTAKPLKESSLEVQALSMNPELFAENVEFARQAGLGMYYFWGVEWWYWMKTKHDQPEIWNSAKELFAE